MTKKLLTSILAVVLSFTFFPALITETQAASDGYDYTKALKFASKNWNSGKGQCAEFVSDCLKAGGVTSVYNTSADGLYHDLVASKLGKSYKLKLTGGNTKYVSKKDNASVLQKGDPIFFYCNTCKRHTHVVINNGFNAAGYSVDYAHNNPHNGKTKTCTYTHRECGRRNWTFYSIRMTNENLLYGKKTSLSAPVISSLKNDVDGVVIKWNAVKGAESYRVYRKTAGTSWKNIGSVEGTSFKDITVVNSVEYTYTVKAMNGKTASQYYGGKSIKFLSAPAFTSIESNDKGIVVKWEQNVNADGYYLYRKINNEPWQRYRKINGAKKTTYTDTAVKEGTSYSYRVLAYDGSVLSGYYFGGIKGQLVKAPKLQPLVNDIEGVKVSWSASNGADSYRIYRRSDDNKKWILLDEVKETSFIDTTAESGKTYRYTVRADSDYNKGGFNTKGVSKLFLDVPELEAISGDNGITLSWEEISGAKGYYLYQKTSDDAKWARISNVKDADEMVVNELQLNEDYTYTIKAYSGKVTSSYVKDGITCTYGSHLTAQTTETIL